MPLDSQAARRFYDRLGRLQDTQAFYENAAFAQLTQLARFDESRSLFELGCGTGRYAARLLANVLPADARYLGVDVSPRMVELASTRLEPWHPRAEVRLVDPPALALPGEDRGFDRFLATYVLDLLTPEDARALLAEARRLLTPNGRLALVSLTHGTSRPSKLLSGGWDALAARWPSLVGGCRPIELQRLLDDGGWTIEDREVVISWAVPSEVLVARRRVP